MIELKRAFRRGPRGPLAVKGNELATHNGNQTVALVYDVGGVYAEDTAQLLRHSYNHFLPVTKALAEALDTGDNVCGCGTCGGCKTLARLRLVLEKAIHVAALPK